MPQDTTSNNIKWEVNVHSVVDTITNSSSEVFVCNTDKSVEMVKEILTEILSLYNKYTDYSYGDIPFDEVFKRVYIAEGKEHFPPIDVDIPLGKVIIETRDCAVPYNLIGLIEEIFNAAKYRA